MEQPPPLDVIRQMPYNAETPESALIAKITPTANVYVRSNFEVPVLTEEHVIEVGGAVLRPLTLTMDALKKIPQRSVLATMECAGNDRLGMQPLPEGEPWRHGAISTIMWTGAPLASVLAMAGVSEDAVEVLVTAADAGTRDDAGDEVRFARALPIADALRDETLLALAMNEEPLMPAHGFPVRLAVPGWYGMASVKWVTRIDVITKPFEGYFHKKRYVYVENSGITPVNRTRVKSIITTPANESYTARTVSISGWAWSGWGIITRVEVGIDGGDVWHEAKLGSSNSSYEWTPWSLTLSLPRAGRFALRSRATDATGATQPGQIVWNRLGYGNNAIRHIVINVD